MRAMVLSFFALLIVIFGTIFAYKVWQKEDDSIKFNNLNQLTKTVDITRIDVPDGKNLVPKGAILGVNDVYTIRYSYVVETDTKESIDVKLNNVILKNSDGIYVGDDMLSMVYSVKPIDENHQIVNIDISLNEPETQSQYDLLKDSNISFQFVFAIV